jgi:predicted methyltransferase
MTRNLAAALTYDAAVAKSDLLRRADDARDQVSYKSPAHGKTDRFVVVFRKTAS